MLDDSTRKRGLGWIVRAQSVSLAPLVDIAGLFEMEPTAGVTGRSGKSSRLVRE
jgi:hypothetical protein